jgi:hypothetical protein
MTRILRAVSAISLSLAVLSAAEPILAQTPATASDFYLQYVKVFASAKKVEDLLPYMSADTKKQIESTPPAERVQMFEMVKMMGDHTNVKVAKETKTATGATLNVTAIDSDKKPVTGEITIVKEGNAFKIGKESWKN